MSTSLDSNRWETKKMLSYAEMKKRVEDAFGLTLDRVADKKNDTSKVYRIPGFLGGSRAENI
jgi:cyclic pyranopterin phosphate synthase